MSDLFDMLVPESAAPKESLTDKEVALEIKDMARTHGLEITDAFAEDLADIFRFPPPWYPWAK